jgi:hypothetical protein
MAATLTAPDLRARRDALSDGLGEARPTRPGKRKPVVRGTACAAEGELQRVTGCL